MPDIVNPETRSRMMSGIRGANTKPEMAIRRGLHKRGFRYRLHAKNLPGKPDLVLPKYKAVIFVAGCFWHSHDCYLFKLPDTRRDFWQEKLTGNQKRDADVRERLLNFGWRYLTVWECALRGREKLGETETLDRIVKWLKSEERVGEIRGITCQ